MRARRRCAGAGLAQHILSHATTMTSTAVVNAESSSGVVTAAAAISSASSPRPTTCDSGK